MLFDAVDGTAYLLGEICDRKEFILCIAYLTIVDFLLYFIVNLSVYFNKYRINPSSPLSQKNPPKTPYFPHKSDQ